ncbi:MAG: ABC-F family ATP-binding cassette domain-containing protein [Oscillospiraceae bacterium]|nr:ABC-F family ATP-binding cassette domain-containing protein [Oscillospiraceae bacterium]
MLISAENLQKNYGTKQLLNNITLYLDRGDKIGVIGVNGTGKSTLLRVISGTEEPDEGRVDRDPGVTVSYLPQNPVFPEGATVLSHVVSTLPEDEQVSREFEAKTMLTKLGVALFDEKIENLSGGQRKRIALAETLLKNADVLILDEPTNHLDSEMAGWLEQYLQKFTGGIIMITHDRYFLQNVANRILEMYLGKSYEYEANYEKYLELKLQRLEMAQASERKRQSILRVEKQWIMRGARARSTKNKAHIQRYEELRDMDAPETEDSMKTIAAGASRLGRKTIELENISKTFGDKCVIRDFSYNLLRNDRIGIVGRNGAGKSTLLNIIAGTLQPDTGSIDYGATVKIGYFSQEGAELDLNQKACEYIREIAPYLETNEGQVSATMMMEKFLFTSDLQYSLIGKLSGGERRRLFLLGILMSAPNVLLLDEPTNDLDIETLQVLEDYLHTFPGAVVSVSHDRYFLDKTATSIFEVAEDGIINRYVGGYSDYAEAVKDREAAPKEKKEKPKQAYEPSRTQKLKFSFKEQREFETIDDTIAETEGRIEALEAEIEINAADYVKLSELMAEKEALSAELERLMDRWMYLNELNEKIQAQKG